MELRGDEPKRVQMIMEGNKWMERKIKERVEIESIQLSLCE